MQQSSEGGAQYPTNSISLAQRNTVKTALAEPLVQQSRVGMALRILWRRNEEMVWQQILMHRFACDMFLKNMEGVTMLVSSITGMKGKSPNPAGGKLVNPGIAYWIILESTNIDPRAIVRNLQGVLLGHAEIRLLQEPPFITTIDTIQNTLCTVMKDHSNSFIKRRINESQVETKDMSEKGLATRFVVKPNEFANLAKQAQEALQRGGIYVDIVEY